MWTSPAAVVMDTRGARTWVPELSARGRAFWLRCRCLLCSASRWLLAPPLGRAPPSRGKPPGGSLVMRRSSGWSPIRKHSPRAALRAMRPSSSPNGWPPPLTSCPRRSAGPLLSWTPGASTPAGHPASAMPFTLSTAAVAATLAAQARSRSSITSSTGCTAAELPSPTAHHSASSTTGWFMKVAGESANTATEPSPSTHHLQAGDQAPFTVTANQSQRNPTSPAPTEPREAAVSAYCGAPAPPPPPAPEQSLGCCRSHYEASLIAGEAGGLGVEVALLGEVGCLGGCSQVGVARGRVVAGEFEQVRGNCGQAVVVGYPFVGAECGEQFEAGVWAVHHGYGDRVVEPHDRVVGELHQQLVERHDLWPVGCTGGWCLVVDRGDRRLQLVWASRTAAEHAGDEGHALRDVGRVPTAPVLVGHGD